MIIIALDAMGGDHGPDVTVSAAVHILQRHSDLKLILVGDRNILEAAVSEEGGSVSDRLVVDDRLTLACATQEERLIHARCD